MAGERLIEVVNGDAAGRHGDPRAGSDEAAQARPESRSWTAIVLAGQRPGIDPLASHFGLDLKALVPVAGEAMVTHVVRTLHQCAEVVQIVVLAQNVDALRDAVTMGGGATLLSSGGGISTSILRIAGEADAPWPVLITTADHPLLTPQMITQFLGDVGNADLAVGMVERQTMLAHYPDARRTWLKFADGAWSGANVFALTGDRARAALDLWASAERDRKSPARLFLHFGPMLALRALTRTIGLSNALARAGQRLGLTARLVPMTDPVAAIDVDKPSDHAQAEAILAERRPAS
jgi:GTP:adenosylcobinamide-phosphate guanylyltransferase